MGFRSGATSYGSIMFADNVSFDGTETGGVMALNGQLLIGSSVAPHIRKGSLTSTGGSVNITVGQGTINLEAGAAVPTTFTGNSGVATPAANNLNVVTANATAKFTGSGATLTQDFGLTNLALGSSLPSLAGGTQNAFYGYQSGHSISTGYQNACFGYQAGYSLTGNHLCTFIGDQAGKLHSAGSNANQCVGIGTYAMYGGYQDGNAVAIGHNALSTANVNGGSQIGIGTSALASDASGLCNNAIGYLSQTTLNGGQYNTSLGHQTLQNLVNGNANIVIGVNSGSAYTTNESYNIVLNQTGVVGDDNTIRIGTQGSGAYQQDKCYIAGIVGVTNSNAQVVTIDSTTGQLGVSNTGTGAWTDKSISFSAASGQGYFVTGTATATLPASPSQGDTIKFIVDTTNILTVQANTGQFIRLANSISSLAGTLTNSQQGDAITLVYRSSNATWETLGGNGAWTPA